VDFDRCVGALVRMALRSTYPTRLIVNEPISMKKGPKRPLLFFLKPTWGTMNTLLH